MKTHILQLDAHDDVTSTLDKLGWGKSGRILLVWPEHARILSRRLDLVLLRRRGTDLGAQLALVTKDPLVRFHAHTLGIPVYRSLSKAEKSHWRALRYERYPLLPTPEELVSARGGRPLDHRLDQPPAPPRPLPVAVRLFTFALGVLALLSIAAALFPSAQLTLHPLTRPQEITIAVQALPDLETYSLSGRVPARGINVTVEGRDSRPTSGVMLVPDQPAVGRISLTNMTDHPVNIPVGTVVSTLGDNPIRFSVMVSGVVPSAGDKMILLPVQAVLPGPPGNLPGGQIRAVEGDLGTEVTISNTYGTGGGSERQDAAPTADDRRGLRDKLSAALRQSALHELQDQLHPGDVFVPSSLSLDRTLVETFDPSDLRPADRLELSLRLQFSARMVRGEDLLQLSGAALDANLPADFTALPGSLKIENLSEPETREDGSLTWKIRASRLIEAVLAPDEAIRLSLGLEPSQASQRLSTFMPLKEPAQVSISPGWWPRLPIVPFRILVVRGQ